MERLPGEDVYMCLACSTHIVYGASILHYNYAPPGTGLRGGLSQIIKNVHADVASRRNVGPHTVQDIRCNQCAAHIGYEFVEVAEEKDPVLDVGDFLLRMHKLNQSIADPPQPMHRQGGLAAPAA